jgi:hypothetical protein
VTEFWIKVEVLAGTDIRDAIVSAWRLAGRLGCGVWFEWPDASSAEPIRVNVGPRYDPRGVYAGWCSRVGVPFVGQDWDERHPMVRVLD